MVARVDFAEVFTAGVRDVHPLLQARGLDLLFDYRGPIVDVEVEAPVLPSALSRVFLAAVDTLEAGAVVFSALVEPLDGDRFRLTVAAAAGGHFAALPQRRQVLERLGFEEVRQMSDEALLQSRTPVRHPCSQTGGTLQFVMDPQEGALFSLEMNLPGRPNALELDAASADAHGARAWLISDGRNVSRTLERRLQRLGWATRHLQSVEEAARELERMPAAFSRPALVAACEGSAVTLERLRWLWALLPAATQVVLCTTSDSPSLQRGSPELQVRPIPFSPAELRRFTRRVAGAAEPCGLTEPAPLVFDQRRRALVVDDNPVNQLVATGMLQALGFEVDTASDGLEAIDACMRAAPDLVLMDLHMPGMDGLEATRRLRLLQREGAIRTFPIVAATADVSSQGACEQAGMDAHLAKPLDLAGLEVEIRRVM